MEWVRVMECWNAGVGDCTAETRPSTGRGELVEPRRARPSTKLRMHGYEEFRL